MSTVIDGFDILQYHSYTSIVMSESLEKIITGKSRDIPLGVLASAKQLFYIAMNNVEGKKEKYHIIDPRDPRNPYMAHKMVTDMFKKSEDFPDKNSELEKLTDMLDELPPKKDLTTEQIKYCKKLKTIFRNMFNESNSYSGYYGEHSTYSTGTFDDSDD